ncbi:hypothetical protein F2P81_004153 [Scophthalmus maximus]|uniref:Uncharacterized protein n=1 Tax=Scophthalmus maximus TaxID=52904 RepID=A0A6A4T5F8_SCOMX|nr:hypothetical protein F2P81_004153 [Scophthalmus maximus]
MRNTLRSVVVGAFEYESRALCQRAFQCDCIAVVFRTFYNRHVAVVVFRMRPRCTLKFHAATQFAAVVS